MAAKSNLPIRVTAFVDWNSQLRAVDQQVDRDFSDQARAALRRLGANLSRIIAREEVSARFRLSLRFYCGWTQGYTRTDYFKALSGLVEIFDIDLLFPCERISVVSDIEFGDRLIDGLPKRQHARLGIHLPNTLRRQAWDELNEKMVDTALACDLLSWVRANPDGWAVVVSNDDDMVPPVFVAEAWLQPSAGRVLLMRSQGKPSDKFLVLEGLTR